MTTKWNERAASTLEFFDFDRTNLYGATATFKSKRHDTIPGFEVEFVHDTKHNNPLSGQSAKELPYAKVNFKLPNSDTFDLEVHKDGHLIPGPLHVNSMHLIDEALRIGHAVHLALRKHAQRL